MDTPAATPTTQATAGQPDPAPPAMGALFPLRHRTDPHGPLARLEAAP